MGTPTEKGFKLVRLLLSAACAAWVLFSVLEWWGPGVLCSAGIARECAEGSNRALRATPPDAAAAFRLSRRGCELGDAMSCNNLGVCYQRGSGTTKSLQRAALQYDKVCSLGLGIGCYNRAELADDLPELAARRTENFKRACERGYGLGCRKAWRQSADLKQFLALATRGCDLEDLPSCNVKTLVLAATQPTSSTLRDSVVQLTGSCSQNVTTSCATLGLLYVAGAGVDRDEARGKALLKRGCQPDTPLACSLLENPVLLEDWPSIMRNHELLRRALKISP